jgi:hypothetical protein
MSKSTSILAEGQITGHGDRLTIDLVKPTDSPPVVMLRWPAAPSVCDPNPKALASVAAAMVRILAEAQTAIRKAQRS